MKMKAAIFTDKNNVMVGEVDRPQIGPGEALIKVSYCGICGTDLHVFTGHHPTATFPLIPGHEFVGVLEEVDSTVRPDLKTGDRVVAQPFFACGVCEPCITGHDNVCEQLKVHGVHVNGGFAQYVKVLAKKVYRLPDSVDTRLAALTEPLAVAIHDVRRSGLQVGHRAVIIGGGPIGLLIAMVAKQAGASKVVISEVNEYRIKFAQDMGFTVYNPMAEDYQQKMNSEMNGKGFDVVYEVSGTKPGVASMTELCKIGGTIMMVGMTADKYPINTVKMFTSELTIKGVRIHAQENFEAALRVFEEGSMNDQFIQLISKEFVLDEMDKVFNYALTDKEYFKIVVKI